MRFPSWKAKKRKIFFMALAAGAFVFLGERVHRDPDHSVRKLPTNLLADIAGSFARMYASRFPASDKFSQELVALRSKGKLSSDNEALIRNTVDKVSFHLKMPPAVLWCLMFQESRLNHLEGFNEEKGALGLGQFSFYSFYEVNFHLDRFNDDNLAMFRKTLGMDARPIGAFRGDVYHPSSYFYIPTAVAATGAYLNNRYLHLKRILERKEIQFDPALLWLHAAAAYNKGTRGVLSFWNTQRERRGTKGLAKLLSDREAFFKSFAASDTFDEALERIWPTDDALAYSRELRVHLKNLRDCAVAGGDGNFFRKIPEQEAKP